MKHLRTPADLIQPGSSIEAMRRAVDHCQGCKLYKFATQAVFGEGPERARILLAGEQPGDSEDRQGHPFVGPAGRILDRALEDARIPRDSVYLTNVVKHFKFEERGKRRIHKRPGAVEVQACAPWLAAEILTVKPAMIVCLGATAAQALLGRDYRLTANRGVFQAYAHGSEITATFHPSAVLRAPEEDRDTLYQQFVSDLRKVRERTARMHSAA